MTVTIWVDTETGTWFHNEPVALDTEHWEDHDWETFDNAMSDRQRCDYGIMIAEYVCHHPIADYGGLPTPTAWYAEDEADE
jgi:hypothetical protein